MGKPGLFRAGPANTGHDELVPFWLKAETVSGQLQEGKRGGETVPEGMTGAFCRTQGHEISSWIIMKKPDLFLSLTLASYFSLCLLYFCCSLPNDIFSLIKLCLLAAADVTCNSPLLWPPEETQFFSWSQTSFEGL